MHLAPILVLFFYSLSSAWAHAFGSSSSSLAKPMSPIVMASTTTRCCVSPTLLRRSPLRPLSMSSLVLLRGGQQADEQEHVAEVDDSHVLQDSAEDLPSDSKSIDDENLSTQTTSLSTLTSAAIVAPLSSIASFYAHQLRTRPIQTKSVTAGVIFGLSDYFAQTIERGKEVSGDDGGEKNKKEIVQSRILTTFLVGLLIFGPAANKWYSTMFKIWPSTALLPTLIKAFLGQLLFGPAFTW